MMKTKVATGGINAVACPMAPKKYGGCSGTLFVPITLEKLAEIKGGSSLVVQERATCGHVTEVTFTA